MKNSVHLAGRSLIFATLLFAMGLMTNSCTKNNDNPAYNTPGGGGTSNPNEVLMQGMSFSPASLTVAVGTSVTWRNNDSVAHTVTSDNSLFDSGNVAAGGSYSYSFSTVGTYSYHCTYHSGMTGTIVVK